MPLSVTNKSQRALDVEMTPINPLLLSVAGDATTPAGAKYADSFANNYRQLVAWSSEHEVIALSLLSTARPWVHPSVGVVNVPVGDADGVFIMSCPADERGALRDRQGNGFHLLVDDGRQRRTIAIWLNKVLKWIAAEFVATAWRDKQTDGERRAELYNRLVAYGKVAHVDGADIKNYPPQPYRRELVDGEFVAPWLTESVAEALTGSVPWFTDEGTPILLFLRIDVRGEDVDVMTDDKLLVDDVRMQDAKVKTPLHVKAAQYGRLLAVKDEKGVPKYTVLSLADKLHVSPDTVLRTLYYSEICDKVRKAVDDDVVSLKLSVTGPEAICYVVDKDGKRRLLPVEKQEEIWVELCKSFSFELGEGGNIPDNATTRGVLRTIKKEALQGTEFAEFKERKQERETRSVAASKAAAERRGLDSQGEERGGGEGADTAPSKKAPKKPPHVPVTSKLTAPAPAVVDIRASLHSAAKTLKLKLEKVELPAKPSKDERDLCLGVAFAVAAFYDGDDAPIRRFPVLADAIGVGAKKGRKTRAGYVLSVSPLTTDEERVKHVVDEVLNRWEAAEGHDAGADAAALESVVNDAATSVLGDDVAAEVVVAAASKLKELVDGFEASAKDRFFLVAARETLWG